RSDWSASVSLAVVTKREKLTPRLIFASGTLALQSGSVHRGELSLLITPASSGRLGLEARAPPKICKARVATERLEFRQSPNSSQHTAASLKIFLKPGESLFLVSKICIHASQVLSDGLVPGIF